MSHISTSAIDAAATVEDTCGSLPADTQQTPHVLLQGITVRFGSAVALDDVTLDLPPGARHAVVGENGAGKSTLMKVLFGLLAPTRGQVFVNDTLVSFASPGDALARGIGMVQQHFDLIAPFTVTENITLGTEPLRGGFLDNRAARAAVVALSEQSGLAVPPDARIETLSVATQQRVEILKALYRRARVLILDEPTAVLSPQEARDLWAATRRLTRQGVTVVFIAHKLDEVLANADDVTVLRRGHKIVTTSVAATNAPRLAQAMIGGVPTVQATNRAVVARQQRRDTEATPPRLRLRDITVNDERGAPAVRSASLDIFAGEIVGLAGVDGSGQRELLEAIVGLRKLASGTVEMRDDEQAFSSTNAIRLDALSVRARRDLGLAYIAEDRQRDAVVGPLTCAENFVLGRHREPLYVGGIFNALLRLPVIASAFQKQAKVWDVRGGNDNPPARALSGGNQQKLVMARELGRDGVRLVVAAQPTRGLDFSASAFVHEALRGVAAEQGAAVLVQSLDLGELLALSDRIAVLRGGEIVAVLPREEATEILVGQWMTGAARTQMTEPQTNFPRKEEPTR